MQLAIKQLDAHLKKTLSSLYFISGDEPLLAQEARDAILFAAKTNGFSEKEIYHMDSGFRPEMLIESIQNYSLFSEKKIMDIRNPQAKFDTVITDFFKNYLAEPLNDRIIIISTEKLTPAQQKSAWLDDIKKNGVYLPVWPIQPTELPQWIIERATKMQLKLSSDLAKYLAHFCEGNLLNAQQTLEKLQLLYSTAEISREQLLTVLSDHARFNVFHLSDSLLHGNPKKVIRILTRLEQTGEEPALVLWAICRKLRENSTSDKVKKALQQAARVDETIKGARAGNVWEMLLQLCLITDNFL